LKTLVAVLLAMPVFAASLDVKALEADLQSITKGFDGRVGACIQDTRNLVCLRADERFSMQSVMKLLVGMAVLEQVDQGRMKLDDPVLVRKQDLSLYVQPIANLVNKQGEYRTTIGDLIRRAVVDSDSAATDILIAKLGGPAKVQDFLDRKGVKNVRLDRDERHLQTEIVGITWKPEFVDAKLLDEAISKVPKEERTKAHLFYQRDPRDTATPRGMTQLLRMLADGKLLKPASTAWLIDVMKQTVTFPDRLKAGAGPGWSVGHKTGSSGSYDGLSVATNDVGLLIAPDGSMLAITVFLGDSRADAKEESSVMARISAAAVKHYR
jgi:beta-lactamase class A